MAAPAGLESSESTAPSPSKPVYLAISIAEGEFRRRDDKFGQRTTVGLQDAKHLEGARNRDAVLSASSLCWPGGKTKRRRGENM